MNTHNVTGITGSKKPIQIFDLDGTLTIEFDPTEGDRTGEGLDTYSYWHRITRKLARDPHEFDLREKAWLDRVMATKNIDMMAALMERTKTEIAMFDDQDKNDDAIRRQAVLITRDFFDKGILEIYAIKYMADQLQQDITCVISTGGDEYGAYGFIDGLYACGLLPEHLAKKILVSGTRINWNKMTIEHLNVDALKLRGLELILHEPIEDIKKRTQAVFGNDPIGGDRALLDGFCQYSFVKRTFKNKEVSLPLNCAFFLNWAQMYGYRDRIGDLHASLMENNSQYKEITLWGYQYLASHGYTLKSDLPEEVQHTPWSYVVRFATSVGYIYLKHTPDLLALESAITQILHDQFHSPVPEVIASNTVLNCFLMKDAGQPLRTILKKQFDASLLCKAIDQYTSMQLAVADQIDIFLDIGVPDWRLEKLPALYEELLSHQDVLIADGLSATEILEVKALLPKVFNVCKKLSNHPVKQTLVQCDFHDNNILIDNKTQNITLIDLGEIVISHPFFSLITCLQQVKFHHGLTEQDPAYLQLMDACLENYMSFESKSGLLEAFELARILWFIYEPLAQYRLMVATEKVGFMSLKRHGRLKGALREYMTKCMALD